MVPNARSFTDGGDTAGVSMSRHASASSVHDLFELLPWDSPNMVLLRCRAATVGCSSARRISGSRLRQQSCEEGDQSSAERQWGVDPDPGAGRDLSGHVWLAVGSLRGHAGEEFLTAHLNRLAISQCESGNHGALLPAFFGGDPGGPGPLVGGRPYPEPNRERAHRDEYGFAPASVRKWLTYFYARAEEGSSVGPDDASRGTG